MMNHNDPEDMQNHAGAGLAMQRLLHDFFMTGRMLFHRDVLSYGRRAR